jgi:hypothetical protein
METISTATFIDILGNVMVVPETDAASVQLSEPERGRRKAAPNAKVEDWGSLVAGQRVALWRRRSFVACGSVDEVMPDGSAVWIFIPKEFRRTLVHVSDGITISLAEAV